MQSDKNNEDILEEHGNTESIEYEDLLQNANNEESVVLVK